MRFSNRSNAARLGVFRQEQQLSSCHCEPFAWHHGFVSCVIASRWRSNLYEACCVFCRPFWDVGRLHLSYMGYAEPQRDKLQRPASFLFPKKIASSRTNSSICKFIEQERKVHFVVLRNLSDAVGFYRFATDCAKGDLIDGWNI